MGPEAIHQDARAARFPSPSLLGPSRRHQLLPAPARLQLESLSVSDFLDVDLLDHLIRGSRRSLKELSLVGFGARQLFDFGAYTSLSSLSIRLALSDIDKEDLRLLFVSVGSIPSLRTLAFDLDWGRMHSDFYLIRLEKIRVFHLLPPSLQNLIRTGWMPLSTSYLLGAFADKRCLPSLEYLSLSTGVLKDEEHVRNRPREELKRIQEVAERRGIEIAWSDAEDESDVEQDDFENQGNFID